MKERVRQVERRSSSRVREFDKMSIRALRVDVRYSSVRVRVVIENTFEGTVRTFVHSYIPSMLRSYPVGVVRSTRSTTTYET